MIEVRKTLMAPFCEENVRMSRRLFGHCPDCGGHTRMILVRDTPTDSAPKAAPPQAQIFFCDRCVPGTA